MDQMLDRLEKRCWKNGEAATIVKMIEALCKSMNYSTEDACKATGITEVDYLDAKERLESANFVAMDVKH